MSAETRKSVFRRIGMTRLFECLFSEYRWYRRFYGGRWERHWIDVCGSFLWLSMTRPKVWPEYRQPCSSGTPTIEDWP